MIDDAGENNDISDKLREHVHNLGAGKISPSLIMQLMSDLGILNERLNSAERQRQSVTEKLDNILKGQEEIRSLSQSMGYITAQIAEIKEDNRLNNEFRLKFMGGSVVGKLIWIIVGGGVAVLAEKFFMR